MPAYPNSREAREHALRLAMDHVYTDERSLVRDIAGVLAIGNMGMTLIEYVSSLSHPDRQLARVWDEFYNGTAESDEMADGFDEEREGWIVLAQDALGQVKTAGLDLTPGNLRSAIMREGRFSRAR